MLRFRFVNLALLVAFVAIGCAQARLVQAKELAEDQYEIANQFKRLETLALRIADQAEADEPQRANQIRQTIRRAQTLGVEQRFEEVVTLLEKSQLSSASNDQQALAEQLEELYQLILADPRESQLEKQRKAWEQVEKEVRRLIRAQKSLRLRTERSPAKESAREQQQLGEQTKELSQKEPLKGSSKQLGANPSKPSESSPSEAKPSEGGKPSQPTEAAPQAMPSTAERVTKQLERAEEAMRQAEERLVEEEKKAAAKKQLQAQHELESAQREAEEMLRQLREEEKQRKLASLADRIRKMMKSETALLKSTVALNASKGKRSKRAQAIEATKLAQQQASIKSTANRALKLIEEDGKSLVFAEAMRQTSSDMRMVEERLRIAKTNQLTQQVEQGVIDSLDEMLLAVEETLEKMQEESQSESGGQPSSGEAGLVAKIAELRLLRSSQIRLKRQTVQWQAAKTNGDASQSEAAESFRKLADEQSRLAKAANYAAKQENP